MQYLLFNVFERVRRVDGEADQNDVGIWVREGTETVVIFLASRIPQGQLDVLAINLDIGDIVLKDSGDVNLHVCVSKIEPGGSTFKLDRAVSGAVCSPVLRWAMLSSGRATSKGQY